MIPLQESVYSIVKPWHPFKIDYVTDGRWEDSFEDATGLEDLNQTAVDGGRVRLNGNVHQMWEISSQVSFQAGELDQVDADVLPGALQLALEEFSLNPNQLVGNVSLYHYYEPPALAGDGDQTLHLAWAHTEEDDIFLAAISAGVGAVQVVDAGPDTDGDGSPDAIDCAPEDDEYRGRRCP